MKIKTYTFLLWSALVFSMMLPNCASCQCIEDFYGAWRSVDGKRIDLVLDDEKTGAKYSFVIGNNEIFYSIGSPTFANSIVTLTHYEYQNQTIVKTAFQFQLLDLDKQAMRIRPISQTLISLFGNQNVTLFNENYIPYEKVVIDSFAYRTHANSICLQVNKYGMMKLQKDYPTQHRRRKYYTAQLSESQFLELRQKILYSSILNLSECELMEQFIDTSPSWLTIIHNGKITHFCKSFPGKSLAPLFSFIHGTISKTKWKKVKRKDARLDKAFNFI